jgi:uncharacterized protein YjbI with pentapeptide repeats
MLIFQVSISTWLTSGADLHNADLTKTNLTNVDFYDADLHDAYLIDTNLQGAHLSGAYLSGADLSGANLRGANLWITKLPGVRLRDTNLIEAHLIGANLSGAHLSGANLRYAIIVSIQFYSVTLNEETDFLEAIIDDSNFIDHISKFTKKVPEKINNKRKLRLKLEQRGLTESYSEKILKLSILPEK